MAEIWRPVTGYETHYEVSNRGRVRRILPEQGTRMGVLKNSETLGYYHVHLCKGCIPKHKWVHRLVAEAFIGPCPAHHEVNHKNGKKGDNRPSNLEYVTKRVNLMGRKHVRLTEEIVLAIKKQIAAGVRQKDLARKYRISDATISNVKHGLTWAWVIPKHS